MNEANVLKAIAIMQRAKNFDSLNMTDWQIASDDNAYMTTEDELHSCGNTACFGGHVAVSPEFIEDGGSASQEYGLPEYDNCNGEYAIARWLGISHSLSRSMVYGDTRGGPGIQFSMFYLKEWEEVKPDDVIEKLNMILSGELS